MGTDIYLKWDNKIENESKDISTLFSINAGETGYLRASIGMIRENEFLRYVFDNKHWQGEELPFNFNKEQYDKIIKVGLSYVISTTANTDFTLSESTQQQVEHGNETLKHLGINKLKLTTGTDDLTTLGTDNFRNSITWLNSLLNFYELGMSLQNDNKNPRIYISW